MTCKEPISVTAVLRGAEEGKGPCQGRLQKCKDRFVEPKRAQEGSFSCRSIGGPLGEIELLYPYSQSVGLSPSSLWDQVSGTSQESMCR